MFAHLFVKTFFACTTHSFFFLPPWYKNLKLDASCTPIVKFPEAIMPILLAIVQMLLAVAGFVAVVSIIIAGFEYLTTLGNAEKGVSARKRIINSLIGLTIAIISSSLVSYVGSTLK